MTDRNQWSLVSIAAVALFVLAAVFVGYSVIVGKQMDATAVSVGTSTAPSR